MEFFSRTICETHNSKMFQFYLDDWQKNGNSFCYNHENGPENSRPTFCCLMIYFILFSLLFALSFNICVFKLTHLIAQSFMPMIFKLMECHSPKFFCVHFRKIILFAAIRSCMQWWHLNPRAIPSHGCRS